MPLSYEKMYVTTTFFLGTCRASVMFAPLLRAQRNAVVNVCNQSWWLGRTIGILFLEIFLFLFSGSPSLMMHRKVIGRITLPTDLMYRNKAGNFETVLSK